MKVYYPERAKNKFDLHTWKNPIGRDCLNETPDWWWTKPRTHRQILFRAFGKWDVRLLANAAEPALTSYLLTHPIFGWRLLVSFPPDPDGWLTTRNPAHPPAKIENKTARAAEVLRRRAFVRASFEASCTGAKSLYELLIVQNLVATMNKTPLPESLTPALVDVWLDENGKTGPDAAAARTMVALGGLTMLERFMPAPAVESTATTRDGLRADAQLMNA